MNKWLRMLRPGTSHGSDQVAIAAAEPDDLGQEYVCQHQHIEVRELSAAEFIHYMHSPWSSVPD